MHLLLLSPETGMSILHLFTKRIYGDKNICVGDIFKKKQLKANYAFVQHLKFKYKYLISFVILEHYDISHLQPASLLTKHMWYVLFQIFFLIILHFSHSYVFINDF